MTNPAGGRQTHLFTPERSRPVLESSNPLRLPARNSDPETSKQAAVAVQAVPKLSEFMQDILRLIRLAGPVADDIGAQTMGVKESKYRKRRSDLKTLGLVRDSGLRSGGKYPRIRWEIVP